MAPKSRTISSPASIRRLLGRWWGLAPLGPAVDDGVEGGRRGPAPAHLEVQLEGELLLGRALGQPVADPGQGLVALLRHHRRRRLLHDLLLAASRQPDPDGRVDPGLAQLEGRLVAVTAVGDEEQVVGSDQEQGGRAGEAGQIADVDHAGDEQGVAARLAQPRPQAGYAPGHVHRSVHESNSVT